MHLKCQLYLLHVNELARRLVVLCKTMLVRGLKSLEKCEQNGMKVYFLSYKDLVSGKRFDRHNAMTFCTIQSLTRKPEGRPS